jgi:hypothetical protein
MLKHSMKGRDFQRQQEILQGIIKSWDDLTFTEVQSVFWERIEPPTWVAGNNGQHYPN